jgi:hypothetical protein
MEPTSTYRPRISRETRLLLTAALLAVAVLWILARVRFRDRPTPPSPIPAVLSQLASRPKLDELGTEVAQLGARLRSSFVAVDPGRGSSTAAASQRIAGLRVRDDVAVAWLPPTVRHDAPDLVAVDPAAGIVLVRAPGPRPNPPPATWAPRPPLSPRYLMATDVAAAEVSLRPAFVASFEAIATPLWPEPVWAVPAGSDLTAGTFVFTGEAELVGLVIGFSGQRVIVPAATLLAHADRLLAAPPAPAAPLGIEIQALTPALASATGASAGVIVSWVDPDGAAAERLAVGDVIEAVAGRPVQRRADWNVAAARLSAGTAVTLRVRRRGAVQDVAVVPAAATAPATSSLGLTLRGRTGLGAQVVRLESGAAGERAGLAAADLITLIGDVRAPTPRQVTQAFAALEPGERVIVGVTRGDAHFVTTLERRP